MAALFALHPVNIDSVAWVAERKNILSTTFWLLTMYAYIFYAQHMTLSRYLLIVFFFVLGLLSKPMLVTLPFVLLLMDYWPLGRVGFPLSNNQRMMFTRTVPKVKDISPYLLVVIEKIPLLAGAMVTIYLSSLSINTAGISISREVIPMNLRISNAIVSYALYIGKLIWPVNLNFFYPYPNFVPVWQVMGSIVLLSAVSILALLFYKRYPYVIIGWLWFLGTFVPVLGIMQGGLWPAIAERWAYVPFIGIFFATVWMFSDVLKSTPLKLTGMGVATVVLILYIIRISYQLPFWKDDFTFFKHGIITNPKNYVAYGNLGTFYFFNGQYGKALIYDTESLRLHPSSTIHSNIGNIFYKINKYREAETHFREGLRYTPNDWKLHGFLGCALAEQMKFKDAIYEYKTALAIKPDSVDYNYRLASLLMKLGNAVEAARYYRKILELMPDNFQVRTKLGNAYAAENKFDAAAREYEGVLRFHPDFQYALLGLSSVRARKIKIDENIMALESMLESKPGDLQIVYKLVVLYAGKGDYEKALSYLNRMAAAQPDNPDVYYNIACLKSKESKVDEAMDSLRTAIGKGFKKWDMLKKDRDLENIRSTAFFKNILELHP